MYSDIVVVGAGLCGALLAAVATRDRSQVTLVDRHAAYPADFRAEQLVGPQTEALRQLGLLDSLVGAIEPIGEAVAASRGTVVDTTRARHYGMRYEDMVRAARSMASGAAFVPARATAVETGPERQRVRLEHGRTLEARLVVLATGPGADSLLAPLGVRRTMLSEHHSMTFGFDLQPDPAPFPAPDRVHVCYGERPDDRIDYLTTFPLRGGLRGNLFCYRDPGDPWVRSVRHDPKGMLLSAMPMLERSIGPFAVAGKVQARPSSIWRAENVRQDGIVLVGDAFQSSCPAAGTGISRVLADVAALRRLLPLWLETPGMPAQKIAAFYGDPAKRRMDDQMVRYALRRRLACTSTTLGWRAWRAQHYLRRRTVAELRRQGPLMAQRAGALMAALVG